MKKNILFWGLMFGVLSIHAQSSLDFETMFHDFGKVSEIQNLEYQFVIKNTGKTPVKIRQVQSDCACLSSVHKTEPIQPNESSTILVKYAPYRAGQFSKKFIVLTDSKPGAYELTIKGFIEPNTDEKAREFKYQKGELRFKRKYLNFGTIAHNTPVSRKFEVYNPNDSAVVFTDKITVPEHIGLFFDSTHIIPPKEIRDLVVTYNPRIQKESGYLQESVMMFTNNEENSEIPMTVSIHLLPRKKPIYQAPKEEKIVEPKPEEKTENEPKKEVSEADGKPSISLSESEQNLGEIYPKMTVSTEFEIRNNGKKPLIIEDIVGGKNCVIQKMITEPIPAGESREIEVQIVQSVKKGDQTAVFTIFSNDPEKPKIEGKILVKVVDEKE